MPLLAPSGKQFSLHKLVAMSTMMSPTHGGHQSKGDGFPHQTYFSHAIQDHLRRVYDDVRGTEPLLTRQQFQTWLATVQDHPIELVHEEYKCEEFLQVIYMHHGFDALKDAEVEKKDLTRPLSNYFISSSHNTYLSGNQLASKSSTEAYKHVLTQGCRCIEIDVHNGEPADSKSSHSRSPSAHSETHHEHKRHISISGSTLSSRAAAALGIAEEKYDSARAKLAEKLEKTGLGHLSHSENQNEQRGRPATTNSLEVGSPNGKRASSVRSMRVGEPLVLHGWTLTAPVGFRAVCKTIRDTAFLTSNLPIIISLEVHADPEQQEVMVDIMQEEWKGLLIDQAHEACNPDERLPRLEELLNKILIKVKKAASASETLASPSTNSLAPSKSRTEGESGQSGSEDEKSSQKKKVKICERLSNLGIYTHSEHFVSFEAKSAKKPPHVFSIGEGQINELHETKKEQLIAHNRDFFMRAYPAGFRIDSSNLDPSGFWRKGVQMVALNWQNLDMGMMLNEGMFAGENGWVLKPPGYRSDASEPIQYKSLDLKITVFAGQHIPIPANQTERGFHPYIKCELHVQSPEVASKVEASKEEAKKKEAVDPTGYKQKTPYGKGDHPDFGEDGHVLTFRTVEKVVEELSFVRFKVEDAKYAKDSACAWACIRLDRLQQGYRFVHLLDMKGLPTQGLLFVKIEKVLKPVENVKIVPVPVPVPVAAK
ncbi:PLC-like phosphodiesterase [Stipitochalara longipes BDJ]|nr:PLC-like phosphodiesterase [Stipitochalara longipes BDJ]